MGKAVLHGPHKGEGPTGVANGELFTWVPLEVEKARVPLGGVRLLFLLRVNVVKDGLPRLHPIPEGIHDFHSLVRVDVAVVGELQLLQGIAAVIVSIRREQQAAKAVKSGIVLHVLDSGFPGKGCHALGFRLLLHRCGLCAASGQ